MADCRIKFFVADYRAPEISGYQHELIALAEGFQQLGVPFAGSSNYWMDEETGEYLIKALDGNRPYEINIFHERFLAHYPDWRKYIDVRKTNILIDAADGFYNTPSHDRKAVSSFDLILKTHFNIKMSYPKNVKPWAFGLSRRIIDTIDATDFSTPFSVEILNNFSPGLSDHSLRGFLNTLLQSNKNNPVSAFYSEDEVGEYNEKGYLSYKAQTGNRHNNSYYKTMNQARFTLAYGGFFCFSFLTTFHFIFNRKLQGVNHRLYNIYEKLYSKRSKNLFLINQYDSWRWWESLYSRSVPIHLNFDKFGFVLPELPVEGLHYIGIDDFSQEIKTRMINEDEHIKMSLAGKKWAKDNFSPLPTSIRFLEWIEYGKY